jgi:hypothetical protein
VTDLIGQWVGKSTLRLAWPGEPENLYESATTVTVEDFGGCFQVAYTWEHDGEPQQGRMIAAKAEDGQVTAGWVDTWHQSGAVLQMKGGPGLRVTGSYGVGDGVHPDWGWRIEVRREGEGLMLEMTNISPEGEEEWAVRALCSPAEMA